MSKILWVYSGCRDGRPGSDGVAPDLTIETCWSMAAALERLETAAVLAVEMPQEGWSPEAVLATAHQIRRGLPVILIDGALAITDAVRLAQLGAYQCLHRLPAGPELADLLRSAARYGAPPDAGGEPETNWRKLLIGNSRPMQQIAHIIGLVAQRRCTVLITGETGTGKEMVARAVHLASDRARFPMVAVNCSAIPEALLEAELFGHVRGAFTGAMASRIGRFEQAHRGTLFLDEIGDMPMELQAKLLRVLQEREFQRLGSSETLRVDVRVIAATNCDLLSQVRLGEFREDLYYRLNVVPLHIPALRERREDVPLLANHFLAKHCEAEGIPVKQTSPELMVRLAAYDWPGNVRELENALEAAIAMSGPRALLYPADFPARTFTALRPLPPPSSTQADSGEPLDFCAAVTRFEHGMLRRALEKAGGNKTLAADLLGLKRTTFLTKLRAVSFESA